nr:unnamed protein product [Callosobruchus chinensis]
MFSYIIECLMIIIMTMLVSLFLENFCMSQKVEKPVLSGQRIKTRKRDEKERYDPTGFRDAIISDSINVLMILKQFHVIWTVQAIKLDYRRYGECLFDILIAGGILGKLAV